MINGSLYLKNTSILEEGLQPLPGVSKQKSARLFATIHSEDVPHITDKVTMRFRFPIMYTLSFVLLSGGASALYAQSTTPAVDESRLTPSSELNDKLPSWLRLSGDERARGEGDIGIKFANNATDRYLLNRLRFDSQILPTKWLKFEFQSQDSRAFEREEGPKPPYADTWDLRLAYVQLGGLEQYHTFFRLGRQELAFGDERLIGNSNWTNVARSFDGYSAAMKFGKFRLDAFAASVVVISNTNNGGVSPHTPGNDIEGLYGEMANVIPDTTLQPYFLWRRDPGQKMGSGALATEDFGTAGFRWVGKLPQGFSFNTENAIQRGSLGSNSVAAWASHVQLGYAFPKELQFHPKYMAEFNYSSGDKAAKDSVHSTFDTLYASGHDKIDFADQVGWKNVEEVRTGPDFQLHKKFSTAIRYADIWLANAHDSLYAANGTATITRANGTAGTWVGQEFDGTVIYSLTRTSQLGGGYGYLLPGTFLDKTTPVHSFSYPFLYYNTSF